MNLRVPRVSAGLSVLLIATAIALFVYFMGRFGGPAVSLGGAPYAVNAVIPDAQGLASKSDVLVRGVKVGEVDRIVREGKASRVTFRLQDRYAPVPAAATVRVGTKTVLGEAYVDLDIERAGPPLDDGATLPADQVLDAVELDEALGAFSAAARKDVQSLNRTFARGAASPRTSTRVSQTLGRLDALTAELRALGALLEGQERTIAGVVVDGRTTFDALGDREAALTTLVGSARRTLDATSASRVALGTGLDELPRLLRSAERTLRIAEPLIQETRPLAADLVRLAPVLKAPLDDLGPVARKASRVLDALPAFTRDAVPTLAAAGTALRAAGPAVDVLEPALANLVPMIGFLAERRQTVSAWFANTAAIGANGDAKGKYVRFNIFAEPGTGFGVAGSFSSNSYTKPGDAAANAPHRPGDYPRLLPFRP